ncbi:FAD dependent oxidoreductase [Coniella lustricola]|uniref:FAD dependent oxidoreductase n=1 Tax=Coniella lustricola TaxID=2025994 RepID=A0A2T3ACR6_9PEZI|nr:FAD dependent oxidoreductase [Coniella lustricola]
MTLSALRLPHPAVKGAIVQRHAASMWPYKLVCWVLERLLATYPPEEFNLQTNTPVTRLIKRAVDSGGGHCWIAHTPRGTITADRVLLATNGHTSHLLPAFSDLIVPVRGQIGALLPPLSSSSSSSSLLLSQQAQRVQLDASYVFFGTVEDEHGEGQAGMSTSTSTRDEYLVQRPLPNGELILGGGRNLAKNMAVGEWRDDEVEPQVARYLRSELEPVLDVGRAAAASTASTASTASATTASTSTEAASNKQPELEATMEWTGIMAYSRDHGPWIGAVPSALGGGSGLFMAAGFTGHGMPRCALAGRGVARMMLASAGAGVQDHGIPEEFVATAARAEEARRRWGPVGTVDGMKALIADLKEV